LSEVEFRASILAHVLKHAEDAASENQSDLGMVQSTMIDLVCKRAFEIYGQSGVG
jgi:hypothetical protein